MKTIRRTVLAVALLASASETLHAQPATTTTATDRGWHYAFTPYLWASAMEGQASFKGLPPQPVEMSFGDVFENLDFGALGAFEAHNGRWGVATDVIFMNLGAKIPLPDVAGQREPGVDSRQFMAEADVLYRVWSGEPREGGRASVDLVAGARYSKVCSALETDVLPDTKRSFGWVDAVAGVRVRAPLSGRLSLAGRADVAGFGSDLTWQAHADLRVRVSEHWSLGGGYRYIDVDYDDGEGADRKLWSMVSKGPYVGVQVAW